MKIVQIIARVNRGGTATWLKELIIDLRAMNHEVSLYAGHVQSYEIEDECFATLGGIRIPGLGRAISLKEDFLALQEIRKILKLEKPDVINTHTAKAGVIGRLATLSLGRNRPAIVHTFHGHLLYGYFSKPKTYFLKVIERVLAVKSDTIIAAGDRVRNELLENRIGKSGQFIVSRPGIRIGNLENNETTRKHLGISRDAVVVGWLGRLATIKRPDRVIQLARELKDIVFVIGGDGELLEELRVDLPSNVILCGWTSPELIWAISDFALLTSDNEAQPISLIEAGLAGLPAVAEDVGSVSEVIENDLTGLLVSNFRERIEAVGKLAANTELRTQMGNAAMGYCQQKFGKKQFLDSHIEAYELALKRRALKS